MATRADERTQGPPNDSDPSTLASARGDAATAVPARLGRYVVVEEAGAGGMGRVLRAYDPKLRREVALKLVAAGNESPEGAARIIREAQTMARLSHPNLVPVYDVEQDGDAVFIAMEYVEGDTLRGWLTAATRSWREVLAAFAAAGRGLAAAHAAGIIHRDFKPANAIVGADGRVRVMDFGLARGGVQGAYVDADTAASADAPSDLTQAGVVLGTAPYMAPEQHRGETAGEASDQYAFCVALFEGLYGVRPFAGDDITALVAAKRRGPPAVPPRGGVPRWLHAAIMRGLAVEIGERWRSMYALLVALERGAARARNRRLLAGAAGIVALGGAIAVVHVLDERERTTACVHAGASIAEVWNDDARARLRETVATSESRYAATVAEKVTPWLDGHTAAWQHARTEACLDQSVRGRWDEATLERSLWCLDERRMVLEALIAGVSRADAAVLVRAVYAVAGLGTIESCRDEAMLARLPAPPPQERRDRVRVVREQLARAHALELTGEYGDALALAVTARADAEALDWPPALAAALVQEGSLLERQAAYDASVERTERAYYAAAQLGVWDVAATAAIDLVYVTGFRQAHLAEALAWAEHADVALAHAADPDRLREAARLGNIASAFAVAGEHDHALTRYEQSIALLGDALGRDHPTLAPSFINLGNVYFNKGNLPQARAFYERALRIQEAELGLDHPDVAASLNNLSNLAQLSGDFVEALALLERALALTERALGPDHPDIAVNLYNLGRAYQATGDQAAALPSFERSLAMNERLLGAEHPEVAWSMAALGSALVDTGEHARALAMFERALAIFDRLEGDQPGELEARFDLADLLIANDGDRERARRLVQQAREGFERDGARYATEREALEVWLAAHPEAR